MVEWVLPRVSKSLLRDLVAAMEGDDWWMLDYPGLVKVSRGPIQVEALEEQTKAYQDRRSVVASMVGVSRL